MTKATSNITAPLGAAGWLVAATHTAAQADQRCRRSERKVVDASTRSRPHFSVRKLLRLA